MQNDSYVCVLCEIRPPRWSRVCKYLYTRLDLAKFHLSRFGPQLGLAGSLMSSECHSARRPTTDTQRTCQSTPRAKKHSMFGLSRRMNFMCGDISWKHNPNIVHTILVHTSLCYNNCMWTHTHTPSLPHMTIIFILSETGNFIFTCFIFCLLRCF